MKDCVLCFVHVIFLHLNVNNISKTFSDSAKSSLEAVMYREVRNPIPLSLHLSVKALHQVSMIISSVTFHPPFFEHAWIVNLHMVLLICLLLLPLLLFVILVTLH